MYSCIRDSTISIGLMFLLFSCNTVNNESQVEVYTHAVTGLYNPQSHFVDNTREGFEYAMSFEELEGIEMDVQFSQDSTLWMFHDVFLEERTSGEGRICERTDEYLSQVEFENGNISLSKLKDLDLSIVQGSKKLFIDVKYIGSCAQVVTAQRLIQECNELITHPSFDVFFIINDTLLASEMISLGYTVWSDAYSFEEIELSSSIYSGWFVRNADLTNDEVGLITSANKSIILYEMYSTGSIRKAIEKSPTGVLVEEVKEAVLLSD